MFKIIKNQDSNNNIHKCGALLVSGPCVTPLVTAREVSPNCGQRSPAGLLTCACEMDASCATALPHLRQDRIQVCESVRLAGPYARASEIRPFQLPRLYCEGSTMQGRLRFILSSCPGSTVKEALEKELEDVLSEPIYCIHLCVQTPEAKIAVGRVVCSLLILGFWDPPCSILAFCSQHLLCS